MYIAMHSYIITLILLSTALLGACTPSEQATKPWREALTIIVAQDEGSVEAEFRQQLIALFSKQLQVKVKLLPLSPDKVIPALMTGRAHIAAAGMRSNIAGGLVFAISYQSVRERVVCAKPPRRIKGLLSKHIAVVAGSAQDTALREVRHEMRSLHWEARTSSTVSGLLADVASGKLECTIANEEQLAMAHNLHTKLEGAFDIASPSKLAWAFSPEGDDVLYIEAQNFFKKIRRDGTLRRLLDRYYGHNKRLGAINADAFLTSVRTVLPRYRQLFEEAGLLTGIEWQLLAALGYQESHWNPLATSFTQVRGIMMLTGNTADYMKVSNRLDPRQSIMAGARFLQLIKEKLPLRISDAERTWLALAAYNQGMGHLEDARVLTVRAGLNGDSWGDVKKMMPLLSQPEFFEKTKYGYARGSEAVALTENVHMFYDMLMHMEKSEVPPQPTTPFRLRLPGFTKFKLNN